LPNPKGDDWRQGIGPQPPKKNRNLENHNDTSMIYKRTVDAGRPFDSMRLRRALADREKYSYVLKTSTGATATEGDDGCVTETGGRRQDCFPAAGSLEQRRLARW
jgi:hypothetical protein